MPAPTPPGAKRGGGPTTHTLTLNLALALALNRIFCPRWTYLEQIVCGWTSDLDLGLRLRCKRFALLDFQVRL